MFTLLFQLRSSHYVLNSQARCSTTTNVRGPYQPVHTGETSQRPPCNIGLNTSTLLPVREQCTWRRRPTRRHQAFEQSLSFTSLHLFSRSLEALRTRARQVVPRGPPDPRSFFQQSCSRFRYSHQPNYYILQVQVRGPSVPNLPSGSSSATTCSQRTMEYVCPSPRLATEHRPSGARAYTR